MLSLGHVLVLVSLASARTCPWDDDTLLKWSDPTTWDSGSIPGDGDSLLITKGILLNVDTPALRDIILVDGGKIVFTPYKESRLSADNIKIKQNGSLLIGNADCRFNGRAEIVLTGGPGPDVSMGHYTKGIHVEVGGNLDIHGAEKLSWTKLSATLYPTMDNDEFTIKIVDSPDGWEEGDRLVIASTDYDMNQAEEVEVVGCSPCVELMACSCKVKPLATSLRFSHYGEVYRGVDMRAEVGLLTRNIKIHGDMEDELDTYGGHIKAYEGFETFRIDGAELTQMGQKGHKGRYPIHWHMVKTVDPTKTYARNNAIHHVFQRCITVHGTHGVTVENNVAYNTFGHCYFLEDGGEKNNTFHHNLGLVTKTADTIPSDRMPATFWVTSPLNTLTENSAAGSDGMGIWYIFADNVTGPSAQENFFQPGESFHTQIKTFRTNTVHSNVDTGFMFGHELLADQDFGGPGGTDKCDPRMVPLDPDSPPGLNIVQDLTAYKNVKQNAWSDCRYTTFMTYKSSDAMLGLSLKHNCDVLNSIFIGESPNLGEPNMVRLRNGSQVMWHRSTPRFRQQGDEYIGLQLYDGNPFVSGNTFADFYDDEYKSAGGIGFRKPHAGEWPTLFKNNFFDFKDGAEGNYVKGNERYSFGGNGDTERMGHIFDWDGTITGHPQWTVVRDQPFYSSSRCSPRPHWGNMTVCPHRYVNGMGTGDGFAQIDMTVTRNDVVEYPEINNIHKDPWHPKMSTDHSYIYSFHNSSLPSRFELALEGLDSGHSLLVGICVPLEAGPGDLQVGGHPTPLQRDTFTELREDDTGTGYFWDREVGIIFRRFKVDLPRLPESRLACVGGVCPYLKIDTLLDTSLQLDTDCRNRAYPKYQEEPLQ